MGILASGTLPSGIQLSNVYISFNNESIYVRPNTMNKTIEYTVCYKVFADPSKQGECLIRVPFQVGVPIGEDTGRAFDVVYTHLKSLWPGSIDVIEAVDQTPTSPTSTESPSTLQ
jgi:hypothetical protein